ncbi:MAG: leucine-rich repeat domain-containing protein [Prevotella sp.]|nr:leucine-rich repeat domain-containing protein [Prevotella sp.]
MRQRQLLYLLTAIFAIALTGCSNDAVEEGSYDEWTKGMVIVEAGENYLYFVPTSDGQGMMLTYDRTNMSFEQLVRMMGGSVEAAEGGSEIKGLLTYQGDIVIPSVVNGKPVTAIDQYAFAGNVELTSVIIPESVTDIGQESFGQCPKLNSLTLPSGVKEIKAGTFCGNSVTEIFIPDGLKTIHHFAFLKNTRLKTVHINPDNSQLEEIGKSAFYGCSELTDFDMPESVKKVGEEVFYGCSKLPTMTVPSNWTVIPMGIYGGLSSLTDIVIPASITEICDKAFSDCIRLVDIYFEDNSNLKTLGAKAFYNCKTIKTLTFKGLETINDQAFMNCAAMTSITLNDGLRTIGTQVFEGCKKLSEIHIKSSVPPTASDVITTTATVYIPNGSLEAYMQAPYWNSITNYVEE